MRIFTDIEPTDVMAAEPTPAECLAARMALLNVLTFAAGIIVALAIAS